MPIIVKQIHRILKLVYEKIGDELKVAAVLTKGLDCTASPDAIIKVTISGGARAIRYRIFKNGIKITPNDIAVLDTVTSFIYVVNEAQHGDYAFEIIDANGCLKTTNLVTINPKMVPVINSITQTQSILCHGDKTAAIQVNLDFTKGVGPFSYDVKDVTSLPHIGFGNQVSGLPAGTYEVTVMDSNSCIYKKNITISEPAAVDFEFETVAIQCNSGVNNPGSIKVKNVDGGSPPFTYYVYNNFGEEIAPYPYTATLGQDHTFTLVNYGIYTIIVKDKNGCTKTQTVKMSSPPTDLSIALTTASNCINGGTAKVEALAAISGNNYEFAILENNIIPYSTHFVPADAGTPTIATFIGLTPGVIYTFVVHDLTTGCYFLKESSPITPSSSLSSNIDYISNISCKGSNNGKVAFTISNFDSGVTNVNYQIFKAQNNSPVGVVLNQTLSGSVSFTGELTNLVKGLYYIVFEEIGGPSNGCKIASAVFEIKESLLDLDFLPKVIKNANCNEKGIINLLAKDGTAPYQYQIVTDGSSVGPGTSISPVPPPPSLIPGNWVNQNTFTVDGGNYIVSVKDAYGCVKSMTIYLPKDPEPVIALSVPNLCVPEGTFTIDITASTAGIQPYYLSVNGSIYSPVTLPHILSNQNSGNYTIAIKDVNGCTNSQNTTILSRLGLSSTVIKQPSCTTDDGEIKAIAVGGSGNFEYKIDSGIYSSVFNFTGLSSGSHTIYIKDTTTLCEKSISVTLEVPAAVTGLTLSQKPVTCNGGNDGSITATIATPATGINDNPVYTYSLNGGTPQASNIFSGLATGVYTVKVISGRGCV